MSRPRRCSRAFLVTLILATLSGLLLPGAGTAQERQPFTYMGVLGDIQQSMTANPGHVHVSFSLALATADYFRGGFDDVPDDLDELAFGPSLSLILDAWRRPSGPLQGLSLTLGTQNNLADQVQPVDSEVHDWYESNNFVGVAARFAGGWRAGTTYTIYSSPNDVSPTVHELAFAVGYGGDNVLGRLAPQAKVATRVDDNDGVYAELQLAPAFTPLGDVVTLTVPVVLGVGFDDYYGADTGTSVYGSVGLTAGFPLRFVPSDYGAWTFTVGADMLVRDGDIRRTGRGFDDQDTIVVIGRAGISLVY